MITCSISHIYLRSKIRASSSFPQNENSSLVTDDRKMQWDLLFSILWEGLRSPPSEETIIIELIHNSLQLAVPMSYLSKWLVFLDGESLFSRSLHIKRKFWVKRKTSELTQNQYYTKKWASHGDRVPTSWTLECVFLHRNGGDYDKVLWAVRVACHGWWWIREDPTLLWVVEVTCQPLSFSTCKILLDPVRGVSQRLCEVDI